MLDFEVAAAVIFLSYKMLKGYFFFVIYTDIVEAFDTNLQLTEKLSAIYSLVLLSATRLAIPRDSSRFN